MLLVKLHSISSTFATNYRHVCYKYDSFQNDWHVGLAHLIGKVKIKYQNKNSQICPPNISIIRELCNIRDGRHIMTMNDNEDYLFNIIIIRQYYYI